MTEGCDLMIRLLKDAGFQRAEKVSTDGQPGVFATLDAGAPKSLAVYYMYDVKQVDPSEWSSPPWDAAIVDKPGVGKCVVGRGAVNQKGPEAAFLAALHAYRAANKNSRQSRVRRRGRESPAALPQLSAGPRSRRTPSRCVGFSCRRRPRGSTATSRSRPSRGVIELEMTSSGSGARAEARHPLLQQGARTARRGTSSRR
jgi:hypothetical protein